MARIPRSPQPADGLAIIERYTARALAHAGLLVQAVGSREARRVRNHLADALAEVRAWQTMSTISLTRRLELRRHLQRVEEIASEWHRADPDSVAAPRIALFASEAQIEMLLELTPQAAGGDGERPRPAA